MTQMDMTDITQVRAAAKRLRTFLDCASDGVHILDEDGNVVDCSQSFARMLGYSLDQARRLNIADWEAQIPREQLPAEVRRLMREPALFETVYRRRDGSTLFVEINAAGVSLDGQQYLYAAARDISARRSYEAALKTSEARFRSIFERANTGIAFGDAKGNLIEYNAVLANLLGYHGDELKGVNFGDFTHPDDLEPERELLNEILAGTRSEYRLEKRYLVRDGAVIWVDLSVAAIRDDKGAVTRFVGVLVDITERKRTREQLEQSQQSLRLAQQIARLGSWELDLVTNELHWSAEVFRIFEIDPRRFEASYEAFVAAIHPEDRESVTQAFEASLRERAPYSIEHRLLMPDGRVKYVHEQGESHYDEAGRPLRSLGTVLDITERRRAEQALRDSEARLRNIFENVPIGIFQSTPAGKFVYVNPALAAMLGYASPQELIETVNQSSIAAALYATPERRPLQVKALTEQAGQARVYENRYRCKDGRIIDAILSFGERRDPLTDERFLFGFVYDVTAQKQTEAALVSAKQEAEAANRAKSDFLANMSHEIRTPMNAVLGLTQLLLDTELTTRQRDYLLKLNDATRSLLGILNDILDYAKIEAGKLDLEAVDIEIASVLEHSTNLFALAAEEKGIELIFEVDPELPPVLVGDPLRFKQIINNLLGNAVKFTEQGHVRLSLRVLQWQDDRVSLQVAVGDTGIGMTPAQLERLFTAFGQADTSTTRQFGGTGLGLSITKRLVEMMGGTITVASEAGGGSTFTFTVALPISPTPVRERIAAHLRGMRTLVVEDQALARDVLQSLMAAWSFAADVAASAAAGWDKAQAALQAGQPYELILVDWQLPDFNGIELARQLRAAAAEQPAPGYQIIVVMVTASGRQELQQAPPATCCDALLDKPVIPSQLFDLIANLQNSGLDAQAIQHWSVLQKERSRLPAIRGSRVLLVEDNPTNQLVAGDLLKNMGLEVTLANHGREAIDCVAARHYDAILMDLQMPEMDGIKATQRIRALPQGREVPIIAMTAAAMHADRQASEAAGMNDFVAKPVDVSELTSVLLRWIPPQTGPAGPGAGNAGPAPAGPPLNLPGLDLTTAVQRFGGDWALLRRTLAGFARDFADTAADLDSTLAAGRWGDAARLVHTLKSTAETIGARALAETSQQLEHELAAGYHDALPAVKALLTETLSTLTELSPSTQTAPAGQQRAQLEQWLNDIQVRLQRAGFVPPEWLDELEQTLSEPQALATFARLKAAIEAFDYPAAQAILASLAADCDLTI